MAHVGTAAWQKQSLLFGAVTAVILTAIVWFASTSPVGTSAVAPATAPSGISPAAYWLAVALVVAAVLLGRFAKTKPFAPVAWVLILATIGWWLGFAGAMSRGVAVPYGVAKRYEFVLRPGAEQRIDHLIPAWWYYCLTGPALPTVKVRFADGSLEPVAGRDFRNRTAVALTGDGPANFWVQPAPCDPQKR